MALTESDLKRRWPWINWRLPLPATRTDGKSALLCRICVAVAGMKAGDIEQWPQTAEEFEKHLKEKHP